MLKRRIRHAGCCRCLLVGSLTWYFTCPEMVWIRGGKDRERVKKDRCQKGFKCCIKQVCLLACLQSVVMYPSWFVIASTRLVELTHEDAPRAGMGCIM